MTRGRQLHGLRRGSLRPPSFVGLHQRRAARQYLREAEACADNMETDTRSGRYTYMFLTLLSQVGHPLPLPSLAPFISLVLC